MQHAQTETRPIWTVSQLNRGAKALLEQNFATLLIEGEVSNLSTPASGHMYFTLKDDKAQVRCAMFRHNNSRLNFAVENGAQVVATAKVSLYEGRGDFQLIVDSLEEAGAGALQRAFEALKKKLNQEGLFSADHKKLIPKLPKCIGIVTSPTGAAVRDILSVIKRRFPSIPVIIYPAAVQGEQAAPEICRAIQLANQRGECDVLLVGRGGGSLEDLWPFNEESVARAIFASDIPIVSGVGHEVDISIADFVADQRAATPTAAAELVTPDRLELTQRVDHLSQALQRNFTVAILQKTKQLDALKAMIMQQHPINRVEKMQAECKNLSERLHRILPALLDQKKQQLAQLIRSLNAISPLNTLERGYTIAKKQAQVITDVSQVVKGDKIHLQFHHGEAHCIVSALSESTLWA